MREGGVDLQVLPVFIDDAYRPEGALRQTLRMIEAAHRIAEGNADAVALCLDGAAIDATLASGRIALVLALEGCPAIDADVELLETMHRLGVRIASLTHFGRTALADGSGEDAHRRATDPRRAWPPSPRWSVSASCSTSPTSERPAWSTCSSSPPGR